MGLDKRALGVTAIGCLVLFAVRSRRQVSRSSGMSSGDEVRLVQVISNLLDNAAKYTPEHGRIRVTLRQDSRNAFLSVLDIGLWPEALPGAQAALDVELTILIVSLSALEHVTEKCEAVFRSGHAPSF